MNVTKDDILKLIDNMELKKCPICGCDKLWFKQYFSLGNNVYNVLIKCDNCAYVNTTLRNKSKIDKQLIPSSASYEFLNIYINTNGEGKTDKLIGHEFWIKNGEIVSRDLKCPICGTKLTIRDINPFIRYSGQYRVDIICMCENNHDVAFGVHISKEEFEKMLVR